MNIIINSEQILPQFNKSNLSGVPLKLLECLMVLAWLSSRRFVTGASRFSLDSVFHSGYLRVIINQRHIVWKENQHFYVLPLTTISGLEATNPISWTVFHHPLDPPVLPPLSNCPLHWYLIGVISVEVVLYRVCPTNRFTILIILFQSGTNSFVCVLCVTFYYTITT